MVAGEERERERNKREREAVNALQLKHVMALP